MRDYLTGDPGQQPGAGDSLGSLLGPKTVLASYPIAGTGLNHVLYTTGEAGVHDDDDHPVHQVQVADVLQNARVTGGGSPRQVDYQNAGTSPQVSLWDAEGPKSPLTPSRPDPLQSIVERSPIDADTLKVTPMPKVSMPASRPSQPVHKGKEPSFGWPKYADPTPNDSNRDQWRWEPRNASQEAQDLYPATRQLLSKLGLLGRLWQAVGDDPSSKGIHYADSPSYGAAADINMEPQWDHPTSNIDLSHGKQLVSQLRQNGVVSWYRINTGPAPNGNDFTINHIHMIDPAVPNMDDKKIKQIGLYLQNKPGMAGVNNYQQLQPADVDAFWRRVDPSNVPKLQRRGFNPPAWYWQTHRKQ